MKCKRITGWDESWAIWNRGCKEYHKKYWKRSSPYTRRCRMCARAMVYIYRKSHEKYFLESANIAHHWTGYKKKWQ